MDERSVNVIGQKHQVGTLRLHQICNLGDYFLAERHSSGITGIDEEERFDLGILQLFELRVRELKAVLLRSPDGDELQAIVLKMRQLEIGSKNRRPESDRVTGTQEAISLEGF